MAPSYRPSPQHAILALWDIIRLPGAKTKIASLFIALHSLLFTLAFGTVVFRLLGLRDSLLNEALNDSLSPFIWAIFVVAVLFVAVFFVTLVFWLFSPSLQRTEDVSQTISDNKRLIQEYKDRSSPRNIVAGQAPDSRT